MKTYFVRKSRSFRTCDISRNEHWLIVHRCIRYLETQLIFMESKEYRQPCFIVQYYRRFLFFFFFTIEQMVSNTKFVNASTKAILSNILRNTYLFFRQTLPYLKDEIMDVHLKNEIKILIIDNLNILRYSKDKISLSIIFFFI